MPTVFETQPQQQPTPSSGVDESILPKHRDRMSLFTSYAERPYGLHFETQHEGEDVVVFMRQHFSVNLPWIGVTLLLLIAPFALLPFLFSAFDILPPIPPQYYLVGMIFWYIATFGYALLNFIHWYYNIYIVTTERVIDIDFIQLLYKKFSETRLENIEDVTYTSGGFLAAVFNYGNVIIQTAGEVPNFEFELIPKPAEVVQTIGKLVRNAHK